MLNLETAGMELRDLLAGNSPVVQDTATEARRLVLEVQPTAHQEVEKGWGGYLLFKQVAGAGNTVCWLSLHKKHVSLGFSQGAELDDPARLLVGSGKHSRQVKLTSVEQVLRPEVKVLLENAWRRQPEAAALSDNLRRIRELCLGLPETSEKLSHGHPTFFAGKRSFAVYGLYSPSVAFKPEVTTALELAYDPRYFPTPYMAKNGWWSLRLEGEVDWSEVGALLLESYRQMATKTMLAALRTL